MQPPSQHLILLHKPALMELRILLLKREEPLHQLFFAQLHVALTDPALITIHFDHWASINVGLDMLPFFGFAGSPHQSMEEAYNHQELFLLTLTSYSSILLNKK